MKTVLVRELRQNPARMLRDVEAGENYTITSCNRPIARVGAPNWDGASDLGRDQT